MTTRRVRMGWGLAISLVTCAIALRVGFAGDPPTPAAAPPRAETTFQGRPLGVSGLSLLAGDGDTARFLAIHDNKDSKPPLRPRVSLVVADLESHRVERFDVPWPDGADAPIDLEDVATFPDGKGDAIVMESSGRLFHVRVMRGGPPYRLEVVDPAPAPLPRWGGAAYEKEGGEVPEFEGFALTQVSGGGWVAVWGERGAHEAMGTVFFAPFDATKGVDVDGLGALPIRVPEPKGGDVRDVSAIAVDASGAVWFAAADDEGDDGPFRSAIYRLGRLRSSCSGLWIEREAEPVLARRVEGHKVEGLQVLGGLGASPAFVLGGDDENLGGWFHAD